MLPTTDDLPFERVILGHAVRFEQDEKGHVVVTCGSLPRLLIKAPVVDRAIREAVHEVFLMGGSSPDVETSHG